MRSLEPMSDDLRSAVQAVCRGRNGSSGDVARQTFAHLKAQVDLVLASLENDGVGLEGICPRAERADMAAAVASVLLRETARGHEPRDVGPCPSCGQLYPMAAGDDVGVALVRTPKGREFE